MKSTRTRAKNDFIGSRRSEPIILSDFLPQFYQGRVCKYATGACSEYKKSGLPEIPIKIEKKKMCAKIMQVISTQYYYLLNSFIQKQKKENMSPLFIRIIDVLLYEVTLSYGELL
ncbi:hypothetical protein AVEN_51716-1 [Araneus ventricosus]|uniref:Uncharacterized protein n=1 Tax=Araneus ventricosus TaxID=182803 RepID=A0A4Y2GF92_ARAVE|nr:hypothetical protein AVEN_51716-1 [Araneus ventricosus]